ncbi:MAG: 2-isopropylmalate synthase [Candidatus Aminicenantales bacterium]
MKKQIEIFDTTLRDGEQSPGCSMNLKEKKEVAKQLERLKVDVIEAGFAAASKGDFEAVKTIAENTKECTVASLARALPKDIEIAWESLKKAQRPRIHTFIATSPIHMKYKLKMSEDEVLEAAEQMVKHARNLCEEVEFSAEDATRSETEFLYRVLEKAVAAGASVINIPDTVGYSTPEEFSRLIKNIQENVPNIYRAEISVHCHNDLGMAVANTLAAAQAGATQLECTINGIGERAGNASLEEIVMALHTRKDLFHLDCRVETTQIYRSSKLVSTFIGVPIPPNKAIVGPNAFAHEAGIHQHGVLSKQSTYEIMSPSSIGLSENKIVLGKHSGRHAFEDRLKKLGYSLSKEDLDKTFKAFKELADKKKAVSDWDLEALVHNKYANIPQIYKLERFIINCGNTITSTANIKLSRNNKSREEAAVGDGPMDAAFKAIEKITGLSLKLENYRVQSVTSGKDAQGEVVVKVRKGNKTILGRGLSTDVVEAGIKAYLHAVNKLLSKESLEETEDVKKDSNL